MDPQPRFGHKQPATLTSRSSNPWVRALPFFVFFHLPFLAVFWVGWSYLAVGVCAGLYVVRMFAVTGIYHRYFSHKTYKTSRVTQFLFALWGNSAVQRGPLWWAAHHRHHHLHSESETDVHSPVQRGFVYSHILWIFDPPNFPRRDELVRDFEDYPELLLLDKYDKTLPVVMMLGLFLLGHWCELAHPAWGTNGLQMMVWGFFISTICLAHGTFTINSLAHCWGRRRYRTADDSRNNFILALITLGEGWHNNHHHYANSARNGFFWYEIDITFYVLWLMSKVGLIWDLKPVPEHMLHANTVETAPANAPAAGD